jgi:hypothetical protein
MITASKNSCAHGEYDQDTSHHMTKTKQKHLVTMPAKEELQHTCVLDVRSTRVAQRRLMRRGFIVAEGQGHRASSEN